jgi:hypothetical protein
MIHKPSADSLMFESIEIFPGNTWVQQAVPAMIDLAKKYHCKVWCDWPVNGKPDVRLSVIAASNADDTITDWYKRAGCGQDWSKP